MRIPFFLLLSLMLLNTTQNQAMDYNNQTNSTNHTSKKNLVTINPVVLLFPSLIDLKYEHVFNDIFSFAFNITYYNTTYTKDNPSYAGYSQDWKSSNYKYNNYSADVSTLNFWLQPRFYITRLLSAPSGLFVAPVISLGLINFNGKEIVTNNSTNKTEEIALTSNSISFNTGFIVGYQFIIKERFIIDAYIGPTRYYIANDKMADAFKKAGPNTELILLSWGFGLGYAF